MFDWMSDLFALVASDLAREWDSRPLLNFSNTLILFGTSDPRNS